MEIRNWTPVFGGILLILDTVQSSVEVRSFIHAISRGGEITYPFNSGIEPSSLDLDNNDDIDAYINALVAEVDSQEVTKEEIRVNENHTVKEIDAESSEEQEIEKGDEPPSFSLETREDDAKDDGKIVTKPQELSLKETALDSSEREDASENRIHNQSPDNAVVFNAKENKSRIKLRTSRPNAAYRFLLQSGLAGRIAAMILLWVIEFIHLFIPPLAHLQHWISSKFFKKESDFEYPNDSGPTKDDILTRSELSSFVDGRALDRKARRKVTKQEDSIAASYLKQVGRDARYRYVSLSFLQKHGLGPYKQEGHTRDEMDDNTHQDSLENDMQHGIIKSKNKKKRGGEPAEDDDVDWIFEALTRDDISSNAEGTTNINTESDESSNNGGLKPSSQSSTPGRSRRRSKSLLAAATVSDSSTKRLKAASRPRVSDRQGGGGVLGRIRDLGANNLVSRSILGAYPGDALPPNEAASANGLSTFAMKYGYGDWEDESEDDEYLKSAANRSPTKKRRRPALLGNASKLFDVGSNIEKRRKLSSRKEKKRSLNLSFELGVSSESSPKSKPSIPSKEAFPSDLLMKQRTSKIVRLPTERLREKDSNQSRREEDT
jgi:hypothetical protein